MATARGRKPRDLPG